MYSPGPSSTSERCSGVSHLSFWNSLGKWESRYKHNQSHFHSKCMPGVPMENQQPLFQQWDGTQWCQGLHKPWTCYLLLDTVSQKCLCWTSESDPVLLTQKAVVSDRHIQVSRPGLLVMALAEGGKISKLRGGEQSQAVVLWVPLFVVGVMHIICPLLHSLFLGMSCVMAPCPQTIYYTWFLFASLTCRPTAVWLVFYLQSDFLLPVFPSHRTAHPVARSLRYMYLPVCTWLYGLISCILKSSQKNNS